MISFVKPVFFLFSLVIGEGLAAARTTVAGLLHGYSACDQGYWRSSTRCRPCSVPENSYQKLLCPCEAFRDAVIGCTPNGNGAGVCRPRADAIAECSSRGYTTATPGAIPTSATISSSNSSGSSSSGSNSSGSSSSGSGTVSPAVVPPVSSAATPLPSRQSISTTLFPTPTDSSVGSSDLKIGLSVGCPLIALVIVLLLLLLWYRKRNRQRRRDNTMDIEDAGGTGQHLNVIPTGSLPTIHSSEVSRDQTASNVSSDDSAYASPLQSLLDSSTTSASAYTMGSLPATSSVNEDQGLV